MASEKRFLRPGFASACCDDEGGIGRARARYCRWVRFAHSLACYIVGVANTIWLLCAGGGFAMGHHDYYDPQGPTNGSM